MIPRLLYLCPLLGFPLLLSAAERAALVIGVNSYSAFPADKQLSSPINDAQDVAQRLAAMGFVVRAPVLDGTRQAIMDAKRHFIDEARGAKVALFYFSGHGFQVGDENYLIPSDMPAISSFTVLRENSIQLRDSVMAGLEEAGAGTKVVILDCCRDNPFAGQIAAALGTKSLRTKGGGGEISGYGPGFFLAFASSPGATALDGNGARNSPFTAALIRHLDEEPGANLRDLFDSVKSTVSEVHGQEQVPWVNDSLNRQHVKVLAKIAPSINTPTPPAMSEAEIEKRARQLAAKMAAETSQSSSDTGGPFTNSLGMKFVSVPGTQVRMCIHETRNADYAAYAAAQNGVDDAWRDHLVGDKEYHPVVNVSHEDAEAFCRWLSAKEAKNYRLPTDAEWSVAVGLASEKGR
ncbi:MAG: caspase family protein, partial [Prosthecobacter sp.]